MRRLLIGAAVLVALAAPASANQCPTQIAQLTEHLRQHGSMMKPEQIARVQQLRTQAEEAHRQGRHAEATEAVGQAHAAMGM